MYRVKNLLYKFWNSEGRKVFHTAWQAAGSALVVSLAASRSTSDVKAALFAAGAVALAALKAAYLTQRS